MYHRVFIILLFALTCFISLGESASRCDRVSGTPFYACEDEYVHCPTCCNITAACKCISNLLNCFKRIDCMDEPVVASYIGTCTASNCPADMCEPKLTSDAPDLHYVEQKFILVASTVLTVLGFVYLT
jgi:hypothetical protein